MLENIVWCTVATVDRLGRPRSRILHPYREVDGGFDLWTVLEDGPSSEIVSLLRLTPYRLRITDVATLSGQKAPLSWP
jgi:hypothetical protein